MISQYKRFDSGCRAAEDASEQAEITQINRTGIVEIRIADITETIRIGITLIGIGRGRTVIAVIRNTVTIRIHGLRYGQRSGAANLHLVGTDIDTGIVRSGIAIEIMCEYPFASDRRAGITRG